MGLKASISNLWALTDMRNFLGARKVCEEQN
jgi:hypothetical protein